MMAEEPTKQVEGTAEAKVKEEEAGSSKPTEITSTVVNNEGEKGTVVSSGETSANLGDLDSEVIASLKHEVSSLKKKIADLEKERENDKKKQELMSDITKKKNREDSRDDKEDTESHYQHILTQKEREYKTQLEEKTSKIDALERELHNVKLEKGSIAENYAKELEQAEKDSEEKQRVEAEAREDELQTLRDTHEQEKNDLTLRVQELEADFETREQTHRDLVEDLRKGKADLKSELDSLQSLVSEGKKKVQLLEQELQTLRSEKTSLGEEVRLKEEELVKLKEDSKKAKDEETSAREQELGRENTELKGQIENIRQAEEDKWKGLLLALQTNLQQLTGDKERIEQEGVEKLRQQEARSEAEVTRVTAENKKSLASKEKEWKKAVGDLKSERDTEIKNLKTTHLREKETLLKKKSDELAEQKQEYETKLAMAQSNMSGWFEKSTSWLDGREDRLNGANSSQLEEVTGRVRELQAEVKAKDAELLAQSKSFIESNAIKVAEFQKRLEAEKNRITRLHQVNLDEFKRNQEAVLKARDAEIIRLGKELQDSVGKQKAETSQLKREAEEREKILRQDNDALRAKYDEDMKSVRRDHKKELDAGRQDLKDQLEEQRDRLEGLRIEDLLRQATKFNSDLEKVERESNDMKTKLESQIATLKDDIVTLEAKHKAELAAKETEVETLVGEALGNCEKSSKETLKELNQRYSAHQTRILNDCQKDKEWMQSELKRRDDQAKELEKVYKEKKKNLKQKNLADVAERETIWKGREQELLKEIETLKIRISEQERANSLKESDKVKELRDNVADLERQLQVKDTEVVSKVEAAKKESAKELGEQQWRHAESAKQMLANLSAMEARRTERETELTQLRKELGNLRVECTELGVKIEHAKAAENDANEKLNKKSQEVDGFREENGRLNGVVEAKVERVRELETEVEKVNKDVTKLKADLEKDGNDRRALQDSLNGKEQELKSLQSEVQNHKEKFHCLPREGDTEEGTGNPAKEKGNFITRRFTSLRKGKGKGKNKGKGKKTKSAGGSDRNSYVSDGLGASDTDNLVQGMAASKNGYVPSGK